MATRQEFIDEFIAKHPDAAWANLIEDFIQTLPINFVNRLEKLLEAEKGHAVSRGAIKQAAEKAADTADPPAAAVPGDVNQEGQLNG